MVKNLKDVYLKIGCRSLVYKNLLGIDTTADMPQIEQDLLHKLIFNKDNNNNSSSNNSNNNNNNNNNN